MGGFTLIDERINEPEEPEKTTWFSRQQDYERKWQEYEKQYQQYNLGPVSFEGFKMLVASPEFNFPTITAADIGDKSKRDFLSKTLAVVQTTWFLLQCAARVSQRLALTELELATVALASLNLITYVFWWKKPLQVQEPVKLFSKNHTTQDLVEKKKDTATVNFPNPVTIEIPNSVTVGEVLDKIREMIQRVTLHFWEVLLSPCRHGPLPVIAVTFAGIPIFLIGICFSVIPLAVISLLNILSINDISSQLRHGHILALILYRVRLKLTDLILTFKNIEWNTDAGGFLRFFILYPLLFAFILVLAPFYVLLLLIPFLFNTVFDIMSTDEIPPGARHVPAFYAPKTDSDRYSRMLVFAFFGVFFGGLHLVGWFFEFPTPSDRKLWRLTSITITGIPLFVAPIDFLITEYFSESFYPKLFLGFVMTNLLCMYIPARLALIGQALALLRHQPPSAFVSVDWSMYMPHVLSS